MNSNLFNTDFFELGRQIIRPIHRATNQVAIMNIIMTPFNYLGGVFYGFRESAFYSLAHDSRKISIEKVLNDKYDPLSRRIYITNVMPEGYVYLYEPGDDRPVYLYEPADEQPVYLLEPNAVNVDEVNFVVVLPLAMEPSIPNEKNKLEVKINSTVNRYKLDSKNHSLLWTE